MSGRAAHDFFDGLDIAFTRNVPLGPLTWYGVGGPADYMVHPADADELAIIARRCAEQGVAMHTLGSGANLLVTDEGVRGVVVRLDADHFTHVTASNAHVTAGAGADLAKLILTTAKDGLAGLEVLAGIPASVGGAVRMNCGGKYGEIGPTIDSLTTMKPDGTLETMSRNQLEFGYRRSNLTDRIVLDATFALEPGDPAKLRERVKEVFAYKKSTQPLAEQSAGCAFKNPPLEVSSKGAGQLIDEAGLKGFAVGGAAVSARHANFLTLKAGGTATDLIRLIRAVRMRVAEHSGVQLEPEVVIWGDSPVEP